MSRTYLCNLVAQSDKFDWDLVVVMILGLAGHVRQPLLEPGIEPE
jgi:hypothetical protein